MPHPAHAPPIPARTSAPTAELSLEARMAATDAAMTVRLEEAAVAYEVNTAHIPIKPVDLGDVIAVPPPPALQPPTPYPTPVAGLLQRAHHRLLTDGWCSGALVDEEGARCLYGAIHAEARGDNSLEDSAAAVLLDAIRRKFTSVDSVPSFNDTHSSGRVPMRMLDQAGDLAHARGL
ncbi:hypothetical protein ACFWBC_38845 [Streptomyces sp. NPDC059985]|uniref:DUF6197 family protein n=1 Tax=Streptomyces sp. NPDC059985 TaxID=3347025 RepID=UPI00369639DD